MAEIPPFPRQSLRDSAYLTKWFNVSIRSLSKLRLGNLPDDLFPESFLTAPAHPVELMLVILMEGGWGVDRDWRDYARLAIATRLNKKKSKLFRGAFQSIADQVLEFQLHGGNLKAQKEIRDFGRRMLVTQNPDPHLQACSRLCLSIADEAQIRAFVHPLHWIRATLATEDAQPAFGMAAFQVEMFYQKKTVGDLVRAGLPADF